MSNLVQLFLGGSLAAVALFLGVLVWQLARLPRSDKPQAKRPKSMRSEHPSPQQTVLVIEPRKQSTEVVEQPRVPVSEPDSKAPAETPSRVPPSLTADQIFEQRLRASEDDLRRELLAVPELRLIADEKVLNFRAREEIAVNNARNAAIVALKNSPPPVRDNPAVAALGQLDRELAREERVFANSMKATFPDRRQARAAFTAAAQEQVIYQFNRELQQTMQQAAGEAGLTLRSGPASELAPNAAAEVADLSTSLRALGFVTVLGMPSPRQMPRSPIASRRAGAPPAGSFSQQAVVSAKPRGTESAAVKKARAFQQWCDQYKVERFSGTVPALVQMLQIEDEATRLLLVRELARAKNATSTPELADRAVMDLSPEVRRAAVAALSELSSWHYVPILTRALRYPWPPVADHAAVALRALKPQGAVAALVDLLDLPSPSLPVLDTRTRHYAVRELVRLSHERNCLLCHAASANKDDGLVRGVVPTPGKPMPRPSAGADNYYSAVRGDFVRADITFLRQDFSLLLTEEDGTPRPTPQRYDYVTRLRSLSPREAAELSSSGNYPQREAVLYALRGLTGKDGGASSEKWRELVGIAAKTPNETQDDSVDKTSKPSKAINNH